MKSIIFDIIQIRRWWVHRFESGLTKRSIHIVLYLFYFQLDMLFYRFLQTLKLLFLLTYFKIILLIIRFYYLLKFNPILDSKTILIRMIKYSVLTEYLIKLLFKWILERITILTETDKIFTLIYRSIRNLGWYFSIITGFTLFIIITSDIPVCRSIRVFINNHLKLFTITKHILMTITGCIHYEIYYL